MADDYDVLQGHQGRRIRLTAERWAHSLEHLEMVDQRERVLETLETPDIVIATVKDESVHTYHRLYPKTPVTRKYLLVAVKIVSDDDAFVLTAFFSSQLKKGSTLWQR